MGSASKKLPDLRGRLAEVMLSMRPSAISIYALEERFGAFPKGQLDTLRKYKLAEPCFDVEGECAWRLTAAGRNACPSRVFLSASAELVIAAREARREEMRKAYQ